MLGRRTAIKSFAAMAVGCLALLGYSASSQAQDYPFKEVRFVLPSGAGGPGDLLMRTLSEALEPRLGVTILPENKPGGGGTTGMQHALGLPADGSTLIMSYVATSVANKFLQKNLPYDPAADLEPVSLIASFPLALAVSTNLPVKSLAELTEYAKTQGRKLTYASSGYGSTPHMVMEAFTKVFGLELVHVPFNGPAMAQTEFLAGRIDLYFDALPNLMKNIDSGKHRVLGVAKKERARLAPDIPTLGEVDPRFKDFEYVGWFGVVVKKGTPEALVQRLSDEFVAIVKDPAMQEKLLKLSFEPIGVGHTEFKAYLDGEFTKWSTLIKEANITVQ